MNNVNGFALALLLVLILLDVVLALYVFPKNLREIRKEKNEYTPLRWIIFNVTMSIMLFSIIPIAYQATRLDIPSEHIDLFRALSSSSWVLLVLSFMVGWVSVHAASDILIRRSKRKSHDLEANTKRKS